MKTSRSRLALALAASLGGCAVGPDYQPPAVLTPGGFVAEAAVGSSRVYGAGGVDIRQWWRSLRDPELNSLVDRALASNFDLEIALDRVQEARARVFGTASEALPVVDAVAGGGGGTGSDETNGRLPSEFRAGENSKGLNYIAGAGGAVGNWDLDLFGRIKREVEADQDNAEALMHARDWVYVTVASDVARVYLDMRAEQRLLVVLGENIEAARKAQGLAQSVLDQGLGDELDVDLAKRQLATLESDRGPLIGQIENSKHAIAVLMGQFPEAMTRELAHGGAMPVLPARIPVGLPVDLIRRRPDLAQIERQLAAANALLGAAIADLFPSVSLTGGFGEQGGPRTSVSLSPASVIWTLGPSFSAPVLDFGGLDAAIEVADFRTHEILMIYRQAILNAVRQVDDAVASSHAQQQRLADLDRALTAAREATRIATERYNRGLTDFLNVLDAERQQYDLEQRHVAARQVEAEALVALFEALGGGWPENAALPPIRRPEQASLAAVRYLTSPNPNR